MGREAHTDVTRVVQMSCHTFYPLILKGRPVCLLCTWKEAHIPGDQLRGCLEIGLIACEVGTLRGMIQADPQQGGILLLEANQPVAVVGEDFGAVVP